MRAIVKGKLMPFCREKVESPAVNYRGAKKIGGAKTGSESVERGTDIPQIEHKIGNTPPRLGRSRAEWLLFCHCRTVLISPKYQSTPVFMRYHSNYYRNLSLICR